MRTIIKLCICALFIFSFTACYPLWMSEGREGHGRYYYNNHNYNNRHEYRQARRGNNGWGGGYNRGGDYNRDDER